MSESNSQQATVTAQTEENPNPSKTNANEALESTSESKREGSAEGSEETNSSEFKDTRESLDREMTPSSVSSSVVAAIAAEAAEAAADRESSERDDKNEEKSGNSSYEDFDDNEKVEQKSEKKESDQSKNYYNFLIDQIQTNKNCHIEEDKVDELESKLEELTLKNAGDEKLEKTTKTKKGSAAAASANRRRLSEQKSGDETGEGVPEAVKKGVFYQHDSREGEEEESGGKNAPNRGKSPDKWAHDKFQANVEGGDTGRKTDRRPQNQRGRGARSGGGQRPQQAAAKEEHNEAEGEKVEKRERGNNQSQRENRNRRAPNQDHKESTKSETKGLPLSDYLEKSGAASDITNSTEKVIYI